MALPERLSRVDPLIQRFGEVIPAQLGPPDARRIMSRAAEFELAIVREKVGHLFATGNRLIATYPGVPDLGFEACTEPVPSGINNVDLVISKRCIYGERAVKLREELVLQARKIVSGRPETMNLYTLTEDLNSLRSPDSSEFTVTSHADIEPKPEEKPSQDTLAELEAKFAAIEESLSHR